MICPAGFRRFEELASVCFDYGHARVTDGTFELDASVRGSKLDNEVVASFLCGHLVLDEVLTSEILDPHLMDQSGALVRVSAYFLFEIDPSLRVHKHAQYWENRFKRFSRVNARNGLVDIASGVARRDYCIGPPESGSLPETPKALQGLIQSLNGRLVCFPEEEFPRNPTELRETLAIIKKRRSSFYRGPIAKRVGRPRAAQPKSVVDAYAGLYACQDAFDENSVLQKVDGEWPHSLAGDSWDEALGKVIDRTNSVDFSLDTLRRHLGLKR